MQDYRTEETEETEEGEILEKPEQEDEEEETQILENLDFLKSWRPKEPQEEQEPQLGMRWYKFILWVQLWVSAVSNIINAVLYATGAYYGSDRAIVYNSCRGLRFADLGMAMCSMALAVACIAVRRNLRDFRKNAPIQYLGIWALGIVIPLLYAGVVYLIVGAEALSQDFAANFTSVFSTLVMIGANYIYFRKRRHLFVN